MHLKVKNGEHKEFRSFSTQYTIVNKGIKSKKYAYICALNYLTEPQINKIFWSTVTIWLAETQHYQSDE